MYIDCHGHFTTVPTAVRQWRDRQIELIDRGQRLSPDELEVTDDDLVDALESAQVAVQRERGTDITLFSPTAGRMAHHYGDQETSLTWSRLSNDLIARACALFPSNFVGVGQLPQSPNATIEACVDEARRCVEELDFVGFNLNPDTSDGYWQAPPITDEYYYPLYETLSDLGVPAMVHSSMSSNPAVHGTCAHYLNGDTTAFMQLVQSDLFKTFPDLKIIVPHGGGAIPYHWGRYRGVLQDMGRPPLEEIVGNNIFFDTCVYWRKGMQLLVETVPTTNILFASEMIGAVRGIDPDTDHHYDDTRFVLESLEGLSSAEHDAITSGNALRVYSRLEAVLDSRKTAPAVQAIS